MTTLRENIRNVFKLNFEKRCMLCNGLLKTQPHSEDQLYLGERPIDLNTVCYRCLRLHFDGILSTNVYPKRWELVFELVLAPFLYYVIGMSIHDLITSINFGNIGFSIIKFIAIFFYLLLLVVYSIRLGSNLFIHYKIRKRYSTLGAFSCPNCHCDLTNLNSKHNTDNPSGYDYFCPNCQQPIQGIKNLEDDSPLLSFLIIFIWMITFAIRQFD